MIERLGVRLKDEIKRFPYAGQVFTGNVKSCGLAESDGKEDGVVVFEQPGDALTIDSRIQTNVDSADGFNLFNLGECERGVILVHGNAVCVDASREFARFINSNGVSVFAKFVGTGEPGGAGTDNRDVPSGTLAGLKELDILVAGLVARISLKAADPDRGFKQGVVDAGALAENFCRTSAGTGTTEDVGTENGLGSTDRISMQYLANEPGNVYVRRTGTGAWRVVTK